MGKSFDPVFRVTDAGRSRISAALRVLAERLSEAKAGSAMLVQGLREQAQADYVRAVATALDEIRSSSSETHRHPAEFADTLRGCQFRITDAASMRWSDEAWNEFTPARTLSDIPYLHRVGCIPGPERVDASGDATGAPARDPNARVPALLPIIGSRSLIFSCQDGNALDAAQAAIQSVLLRLAATVPPGKLRFTLVDHTGLGDAFSALSSFHKFIRGDMAWHEPRHIDEALVGLTAHISMVIQKYLTDRFPTIEAYNDAAGDVPEAYRVLAIAGFPAGFTREMAERVLTIAKNGPRSGVYVLMTLARQAVPTRGIDTQELERVCTILESSGALPVSPPRSGFRYRDPLPGNPVVELDPVPGPELTRLITDAVNADYVRAGTIPLAFERLAPVKLFGETTIDGLAVPVGRRGAAEVQELQLGQPGTVHHALVCGRTGSGKTNLLHVTIVSAALRYSPDELELYLIDFKEGVEFQDYRELPHARVVAVESEREFGLSVLEGLRAELNARGELFRKAGVTSLSEFRRQTNATLSRVLLIVDEFQVFFETNDRLAAKARGLLDDLCRRGRGFGIHVLLCSQTLRGLDGTLEPATLAQIGLRVALPMDEDDSYRILSRDNDAARHLEPGGEAIFNDKAGHVGGNALCHIAFLSGGDRRAALASVSGYAAARGVRRCPLVFEGNRPGRIDANGEFWDPPPTANGRVSSVPLFLGEPCAVQRTHVAFRTRRQSRSNLLIVGQEEPDAFAVFYSAALSWAAKLPVGRGQLYVLNLAMTDDPLHEHVEALGECGPHVRVVGRPDISDLMATLSKLLDERARAAEAGSVVGEPTLAAIFGLHRARRDLSREGAGTPEPLKQFSRLLRDGPDRGLHVMVWADTHANLMRAIDSREVNEFDGRVALAGGESGKILGDHGGSVKLRRNFGVLYEPEFPDVTRKFRCYDLSMVDWARQEFATRRERDVAG